MAGADQSNVQPSFLGPHEDRELELMLAGKKHLGSFSLEEGMEREVFPERQFDLHVADGLFVKDIRIEHYVSAVGEEITMRSVLYATAGEAWRIPAMRMVRDIYSSMGPGWRPDLERIIGSLLGYDRNDVEQFIERLAGRPGWRRACGDPVRLQHKTSTRDLDNRLGVEMTGQVQGKVALVTGGASGIGAAVAELLAREGASVAITDIDEFNGEQFAAALKKAGYAAMFLHQDVTSEDRWVEVVAEVEKRFGRLDILVSNAGIGIGVPSIVDMTLADWRRQTAINLDGVFLSVKHCLPAMRRSGGGSVIMMSSLAGLRGSAGLAGYCATKGGVRLFAKAVAMECASVGDRIRVNSVHPGIIDTPIWGKIPTEATGSGQNAPIDPEERAKLATPLARAGHASEIASGVLYLASDSSAYVTGTELVIDGGMNAGGVARRA